MKRVPESAVRWEITRRLDSGDFDDVAALADALADGWAPFAVIQRDQDFAPTIYLRRPVR